MGENKGHAVKVPLASGIDAEEDSATDIVTPKTNTENAQKVIDFVYV